MCKYTVCFYEVSLNVPISQVVNKYFQQVYNSEEFYLDGSGIGEWGVGFPLWKIRGIFTVGFVSKRPHWVESSVLGEI